MRINRHEDFIIHLARLVRPKLFVNLGLHQCALFNRIIPYAEKSIGVDIQPEAGNFMKQSPATRFVKGTTQEFARELEVKPLQINLLLIDSDQGKPEVLENFPEFIRFIAPRGLILLYDSCPENVEPMNLGLSEETYQEVEISGQDTRPFELIPIPVSSGLTICRKRQVQLALH